MIKLNQQELLKLFTYNQETGELFWKEGNGHHITAGRRAGIIDSLYYYVCINDRKYKNARIIWCLMTGETPIEIDHINGNKLDDRWCNLRNVTRRGNMQNLKIHREGKLVGVKHNANHTKWRAEAQVNKKTKYIGTFDTEKEAHEAYCKFVNSLNEKR